MTAQQLALILPLAIVAATVVVVSLFISIHRSHVLTLVLTLAGLALAFATLFGVAGAPVRQATPLLVVDDYALFYSGLILAATAAVALLSYGYLEGRLEQRDEYYLLLLLAALGGMVLVAAAHFAAFFLGLELLSVSLYGLIAYPRIRLEGIEAGLKYLVLAAVSAAFLLFGIALMYAELGTLDFAGMATTAPTGGGALVALVGVGLVLVGFGFKLALVPFHLWTPDVYQGAPAPVTAFVATVSKGAMFALLLRYFAVIDVGAHRSLFVVFVVLAVASMIGGNLLALLQSNVKRLLAYSSIAHLGYLLVAFLASGPVATIAVSFYLVAYFVTTIGAFGVVAVLSPAGGELETIDDYRGLFARRPWMSTVFAGMLLSLAGIPLTAGFVGKFYVTVAAGGAALWGLVVVMMLTSGVGLYYYLRVIVAMFMQPSEAAAAPEAPAVPLPGGLTLAALTILLVWLGVYPTPIIALIRSAALQ